MHVFGTNAQRQNVSDSARAFAEVANDDIAAIQAHNNVGVAAAKLKVFDFWGEPGFIFAAHFEMLGTHSSDSLRISGFANIHKIHGRLADERRYELVCGPLIN